MSELSIFVVESGDFGEYAKHSPYYVLTMVFHDQSTDLSKQISILDEYLDNMGYSDVCGFEPISMRDDFATIYGDDVEVVDYEELEVEESLDPAA